MNLKKFEHKNILITGAGSGIGEALSCLLAKAPANLFLMDRNRERLSAVRDKCDDIRKSCLNASGSGFASDSVSDSTSASDSISISGTASVSASDVASGKSGVSDYSTQIFYVDFSDMSSIDSVVADITNKNIPFDYIFLNAGISQRALTLDTDIEVDRKIMETNYFGPVYLIKKLPCIKSGRPVHLAVTTSISGLFGFPLRSAYCASKHALFGFFESLELENENIKVTFLIPGRINTPISKSAILGDGSTYSKMDSGQAGGMDVDKCARVAVRAVAKGKHRKLIGGKELIMVYIKKYMPPLFYLLARKIEAT
jgi:short-subunit dehydrogenase